MSNELARVAPATTLSIVEEQTAFTGQQVAMLQHIGVDSASEADLQVFFHQCKRTGLDPFTRQIYMIARKGKQTIQTGIDGFRLIGRRAADRMNHTVKVHPPQWAHSDGTWRDVWMKAWGDPVGARVTIERDGSPFTATALFDEYKQTKYGGGLTAMWTQRPGGQIAKCAEAAAWRMSFPHDLSGIYADEEMQQADNSTRAAPTATGPGVDSLLNPEPPAPAPEQFEDMGEQPEPNISQQIQDTAAGITDAATMADYADYLKNEGAPAHVLDYLNNLMKGL